MSQPSTALEPRLLTRREVAYLLRMSEGAVDRMIQDGRIPSIKLGRLRRVPLAALDDWLKRVQDEQGVAG